MMLLLMYRLSDIFFQQNQCVLVENIQSMNLDHQDHSNYAYIDRINNFLIFSLFSDKIALNKIGFWSILVVYETHCCSCLEILNQNCGSLKHKLSKSCYKLWKVMLKNQSMLIGTRIKKIRNTNHYDFIS